MKAAETAADKVAAAASDGNSSIWWQQQHLVAAAAEGEMAAAVGQAAAAGRADAAVDWRNRERLRKHSDGLAEEATAEWRKMIFSISRKQWEGQQKRMH